MRLDSMLEPRSKLRQRPRLQEFAGTVVGHLPRQSDDNERFVPLIEFKIQTQTPVAFREAAARHVPQTQFSLALGTVPRSSDFCKAAIAARQQKVPTNG